MGAIFREYLRIMDQWRSTVLTALFEVDYEEVVSNFETSARRIVSAAGLDWDPACGEFHRGTRSVHTGSRVQVRQPPHTRSVAKWKHYEHELADLFAALPNEGGDGASRLLSAHLGGPSRAWPGRA
jgi:hypothetical protein